jgi:hypothetical protein
MPLLYSHRAASGNAAFRVPGVPLGTPGVQKESAEGEKESDSCLCSCDSRFNGLFGDGSFGSGHLGASCGCGSCLMEISVYVLGLEEDLR